jgi:hypothetical protein
MGFFFLTEIREPFPPSRTFLRGRPPIYSVCFHLSLTISSSGGCTG